MLAACLVTLALVELGFRLFGPQEPDPWLGYEMYPDNPRGYFRACGPGRFCLGANRTGLGCDRRFSEGLARVLVVGDSFAYGQGVYAEDTFAMRLRGPGRDVRNCARPGHFLADVIQTVTEQAERQRPHMIIYALVLNDFMCADLPDDGPHMTRTDGEEGNGPINDYILVRNQNLEELLASRRRGMGWVSVFLHSQAVRWFYRRWVNREIATATEDYYRACLAAASIDADLDRIAELRGQTDYLLVAILPLLVQLDGDYPFEAGHRRIKEGLEARGVNVLDLLSVFRGRDADELVVHRTDLHPNEVAHALIAEALGKYVEAAAVDR